MPQNTLEDCFSTLDLPKGIKQDALQNALDIQKSTGVTTRKDSRNRRYLIFVSVFKAYQDNGPIDIIKIGNMTNMDKNEMKKAFSKYSRVNNKILIEYKHRMTTVNYIKSFSDDLNFDERYANLISEDYLNFKNKHPWIEINANPRTLAIAFIKLYVLQKSGKDYNVKYLSNITCDCETSINDHYNKLSSLY